jgi:hypothetical protein
MPRRVWTEREVKRANDMRAAGYSYPTIDKALGRRGDATQQRLEIAGHGSGSHVTSRRIPDMLLGPANWFCPLFVIEVPHIVRVTFLTKLYCGWIEIGQLRIASGWCGARRGSKIWLPPPP